MRILMIASEADPFAKTGGLADVTAALPRALVRLGHSVDLVMPRYRGIETGGRVAEVTFDQGDRHIAAGICSLQQDGVRYVFVDHPESFDREFLYGAPDRDYDDNSGRFAILCRAGLEWASSSSDGYDVIHAHDWQTGLVPVFLAQGIVPRLRDVPVVFTIHNLAYQGRADASWLSRLGLSWDLLRVDALEFWGGISLLKAGIVFSQVITTVSPHYAEEIQTPEYGCGLDGLLKSRADDLFGILNGIDYDQWNPAGDRYLPVPFDADRLNSKATVKRALLQRAGWSTDTSSLQLPVVGMISRMVEQKGFDLLASSGDELGRLGARFVVLGTGERRYEDFWRGLAQANPDRVAVTIGFSEEMAHLIEGGADLFLMPSRFEPCGLNQMYSQRYGTVPVVRATGGLSDTVRNFDPISGSGTGFTFEEYSSEALLRALRSALAVFQNQARWRRLQVAGMQRDFSWNQSARQYAGVYERVGSRGPARDDAS
jgi:starch synthase